MSGGVALPRIMVAPNGAVRGKTDHPALPVTVAEIVATAAACARAGADGLHAHVRDADGQHVLDAGLYRELLAEMARVLPGFYVQITTEAVGRYSPDEQRALVRAVRPKAVSVALREMMAGDEAAARSFYHDCAAAGIEVQHILYDAPEVDRLADLQAQGILPAGQLALLHVQGRYAPGQVSTPADLAGPLARQEARNLRADWAVCAFGTAETACLVAAVAAGGKARIGFENNLTHADGRVARDNAERVAVLRAALEAARLGSV